MPKCAESCAYDTPESATKTEARYVIGLGTHLVGGYRDRVHAADEPVTRLKLLMNYRATLDWGAGRDWGLVDVERIREVVQEEISKEMDKLPAPGVPVYIPTNGHGLIGARRYAVPVGRARVVIGESGGEDDE